MSWPGKVTAPVPYWRHVGWDKVWSKIHKRWGRTYERGNGKQATRRHPGPAPRAWRIAHRAKAAGRPPDPELRIFHRGRAGAHPPDLDDHPGGSRDRLP